MILIFFFFFFWSKNRRSGFLPQPIPVNLSIRASHKQLKSSYMKLAIFQLCETKGYLDFNSNILIAPKQGQEKESSLHQSKYLQ